MGKSIRVSLDFDLDEVRKFLGSGGDLKVLTDEEIKKLEQSGVSFDMHNTTLGQRMLVFKLVAKFKQFPDYVPELFEKYNPAKLEVPQTVFQHVHEIVPMHNGLFCADNILGLDRSTYKKK
jgi:hypothetical protein